MNFDAIGFVDFYNEPSLGEITENRTLGSTSFLGRYAFCDFALSNFTNSGILNVGLLIKDHQRSVLKHLGNMSAWVTNTKIGKQTIMYNEQGILNPWLNTDIANIRQNDWALYDSSASYLIFQSTHVIANVDLRPILKEHIARGEKITVVATKIKDASKEFLNESLYRIDKDHYLTGIKKNDRQKEEALASMSIWIINRTVLAEIIAKRAVWNERAGMREMLAELLQDGSYKIHCHIWEGDYVRCFDSYDHYVEYSMEMLNPARIKALFDEDWPHYTLTHDTPPALYSEGASVSNSFVSNGAIVAGTVVNSIISRHVKIAKGAVIRNAIIFSSVAIDENCVIENAVIDKYSILQKDRAFQGDPSKFVFLKQGSIL